MPASRRRAAQRRSRPPTAPPSSASPAACACSRAARSLPSRATVSSAAPPSRLRRAASTASRRYSRSAVSTWSLRERPRWTRPPASPIFAVRRFSSAVCPSSSASSTRHSPRACSAPIVQPGRGSPRVRRQSRPCCTQHLRVRDRGAHVVGDQPFVQRVVLARRVRSTRSSSGLPLSHRRVIRLPAACCSAGAQRLDVATIERAGAFVGEHLGEDAVGRLVRDDVHAAHAAADRFLDGLGLRQHAVLDGCPGRAGASGPARSVYEITEPGIRPRSQDAGRAGAQDQLLGAERRADRRGHGVGIDVQQLPLSSADSGLTTGIRPLSSSLLQHIGGRPGRCRRRSRSRRLALPSVSLTARACARGSGRRRRR
jgi:hypothetical protein